MDQISVQVSSQEDPQTKPQKKGSEFKLRGFYYLAELSGEAMLLFLGILVFHYRQYIPWIPYPFFNFWLIVSSVVLHTICFILREITRKRIFFVIARYVFLAFFCVFIYTTGAIESPFVYLLMFPLLVSTADLDERATRQIGYIVVSFLALITVLDPRSITDVRFALLHGIQVVLYALISIYLYHIVTETLKQKYEKEEANKKLLRIVELDRMKTVFVTIAQHQLRTPLSGVRWALDNLLKENKVSADAMPILQESYNKVDESIRIVGEMLKTAESDIGGFEQRKGPVDLVAMLQDVINKLAYLTKKSSVQVRLEHSGDCTFIGDHDALEPALSNVVDNAIRYSPKGRVTISIAGEKNRIKIDIADTGVGIDTLDQQNIFERFYRGKNAIAIDPNESGIGLYSTKNIIQLHNGTIDFTSIVGKGTTFTIVFPR